MAGNQHESAQAITGGQLQQQKHAPAPGRRRMSGLDMITRAMILSETKPIKSGAPATAKPQQKPPVTHILPAPASTSPPASATSAPAADTKRRPSPHWVSPASSIHNGNEGAPSSATAAPFFTGSTAPPTTAAAPTKPSSAAPPSNQRQDAILRAAASLISPAMYPQSTESINAAAVISSPMTFPGKLYEMLEAAESCGFDNVVSWQDAGRSFKVHDARVFVNSIMTKYFRQTKYKSFQRQLNLYNFSRITTLGSPYKGGYSHPHFVRGHPDLLHRINRVGNNSNNGNNSAAGGGAVNTTSAAPGTTTTTANNDTANTSATSAMETTGAVKPLASYSAQAIAQTRATQDEALQMSFHTAASSKLAQTGNPVSSHIATLRDARKRSRSASSDATDSISSIQILAAANQILAAQNINQLSPNVLSVLLSQRVDPPEAPVVILPNTLAPSDASSLANRLPRRASLQEQESDAQELILSECKFPWKLHDMLDVAESTPQFHSIMGWQKMEASDSQWAFQVHDPDRFVKELLPLFFKQTKFKSFLRQLNLYGFVRIATGFYKGCYAHPNFVKGNRTLCRHMVRQNRNGRRFSSTVSLSDEGKAIASDSSETTSDNNDAMNTTTDSIIDTILQDCRTSKDFDTQRHVPNLATPEQLLELLQHAAQQPQAPNDRTFQRLASLTADACEHFHAQSKLDATMLLQCLNHLPITMECIAILKFLVLSQHNDFAAHVPKPLLQLLTHSAACQWRTMAKTQRVEFYLNQLPPPVLSQILMQLM